MAYQLDRFSGDDQPAMPEAVATPATHMRVGGGVQQHNDAEVLKVSTRSRPSAVAGAIAGVIREAGHAEVQSIGAGATNQAIKAVAIARSRCRPPLHGEPERAGSSAPAAVQRPTAIRRRAALSGLDAETGLMPTTHKSCFDSGRFCRGQ